MSALQWLERRFSWFAIPDLSYLLVGLTGLTWVFSLVKPALVHFLFLDVAAVRSGEVWRLLSYQFLIQMDPLWVFFSLYWMYMIYRNLEEQWGYFRFTLYWFIGFTVPALSAMIVGGAGPVTILQSSFFLAFATLNPNFEIRLFLILPVKLKYIGGITAAYLLYQLAAGNAVTRVAVAASTLNYVLFFAGHWRDFFAGERRMMEARRRRVGLHSAELVVGRNERKCAICGVKQSEGADIRVCSCEKCGGEKRDLCLHHARNH